MYTNFVEQAPVNHHVVSQPVLLATIAETCTQRDRSLTVRSTFSVSCEDRNQLISEHLQLVRHVARRVYERLPQHLEMEELVSAGKVGLIDAATKFDPTKEVQFKSYAQFRIRGAILDSLRSLDWSPRELRRQGRAIAEATRVLSARLGRCPDDVEIAEEMNLDLRSFQQLKGKMVTLEVVSLNEERSDDTDEERGDSVPAPANQNPFNLCMEGQLRERLASAIAALPERDRLVLTLYYYEELTLKEIGLTLGVAISRVSQLRDSAVAQIRRKMTARPGMQQANRQVA